MLQSTGVYINAPDPCVSLAVSSDLVIAFLQVHAPAPPPH
jgi:hypothetical protein